MTALNEKGAATMPGDDADEPSGSTVAWIAPVGGDRADFAQAYAARGFYVLPLPPNTKTPPPAGWNTRAPLTGAEIFEAWSANRFRNIGLGMGAFVALDPDVKGGRDGVRQLEDLFEKHTGSRRPVTFMQRTPSGGEHWVFRLPEGVSLGNGTGRLKGIDVDVRGGLSGYIVAAPSTINGAAYEIIQNVEPVTLPSWLAALLAPVEESVTAPAEPSPKNAVIDPAHDAMAAAELNSIFALVDTLAAAPEGQHIEIFGAARGWEYNAGFFTLATKAIEVARWPFTSITVDQVYEVWRQRVPAKYAGHDWANALQTAASTWEYGDGKVGGELLFAQLPSQPGAERDVEGAQSDLRPQVSISMDRMYVHDELTRLLVDKHGGTSLFNFGGALCLADDEEARMAVVSTADIRDLVHQSARIVTEDRRGEVTPASFPDSEAKVLMRKFRRYPRLRQVVRTPFVLEDGSVVTEPGFHEESGVLLASDSFSGLWIGQTREEAEQARRYLTEEWLGDMAYAADADRANALALVLTPFVRRWVPLVPMALLDGLTMGTGKGLSMDVMRILWEGQAGIPLPWHSDDNEEQRKALTSAMASGASVLAFDEAHKIRGLAITRLLTSVTYADRWLGKSLEVHYPNNVTTLAAGNQPSVEGDMVRRVYWIRLRPTHESPKDRPASDFRHPDLRAWTHQNRNALLSAVLTIISAWCRAGKPQVQPEVTMGSFEPWCGLMASLLAFCGQPGFLANTQEQRLDASPDDQGWLKHMTFLRREFGAAPFTCADVRKKLQAHSSSLDVTDVAPPGLVDLDRSTYTTSLGHAYRPRRGVVLGGLRIVQADYDGHGKANRYRVEEA